MFLLWGEECQVPVARETQERLLGPAWFSACRLPKSDQYHSFNYHPVIKHGLLEIPFLKTDRCPLKPPFRDFPLLHLKKKYQMVLDLGGQYIPFNLSQPESNIIQTISPMAFIPNSMCCHPC